MAVVWDSQSHYGCLEKQIVIIARAQLIFLFKLFILGSQAMAPTLFGCVFSLKQITLIEAVSHHNGQ